MEATVLRIRLPRIALSCLVGCSLSTAGAAYQGIFQNPMASPDLLGASSALLLNALKILSNLPDDMHLMSPVVLDPIQHLKVAHLGNRNPRLHTDETLIALSICAATNPLAELAMEQLSKLKGCEVHSTVILSPVDEKVFKRLGINLTCEPKYSV